MVQANAAPGTTDAPDDFIPAPQGEQPGDANQATTLEPEPSPVPLPEPTQVGQTELILATVAVLFAAGLLWFLKAAIRRSLIASRATLDRANAAAWVWYIVLLLLVVLVVVGVVAGLFDSMTFLGLTAAVLVIGLAIAANMTSRARRSA
jgi:hypothetical protein